MVILSEVTADGYERMLDGFFIPKFGNFTMQEMENKTDDLQAFVNGFKRKLQIKLILIK